MQLISTKLIKKLVHCESIDIVSSPVSCQRSWHKLLPRRVTQSITSPPAAERASACPKGWLMLLQSNPLAMSTKSSGGLTKHAMSTSFSLRGTEGLTKHSPRGKGGLRSFVGTLMLAVPRPWGGLLCLCLCQLGWHRSWHWLQSTSSDKKEYRFTYVTVKNGKITKICLQFFS